MNICKQEDIVRVKGRRKEGKGRYGQEGKYQSDSTNPLQEETKWECTKCELPPCHQK
ncbi:hypothetical protein T01_12129 [Trichinella spiralis]|uniref:Uncharacterized protein n=1 Tax=Trichinella spiralis TaxID=6334 RepID=A0A0V0YYI8_TRISP|nr:hypothetical protein T01_12129 [Trichinella spiralis]